MTYSGCPLIPTDLYPTVVCFLRVFLRFARVTLTGRQFYIFYTEKFLVKGVGYKRQHGVSYKRQHILKKIEISVKNKRQWGLKFRKFWSLSDSTPIFF